MSTTKYDSSSDDEGDFTTTDVTLGYASVETTGDEVSHIGGHSVRLKPTGWNRQLTRADLDRQQTDPSGNTCEVQSMQWLYVSTTAVERR